MSCASCHNDGGQDGRVWDFTGMGEGLRNTVSLNGKGGMAHGFLHWSANFDEIQDFEGQIRAFAGGTGLMSDEAFNSGTRNQPLGDAKAGLSADLDALAAYLSNLGIVADSPFSRTPGGTFLTSQGLAGLDVFVTHDCGSCHTLPRYTDSANANLHDVGTLRDSSGSRLGGPLTGIDTPTLPGVWQTPPYLHDGSALDLAEAVAADSEMDLSIQELEDVAAYLRELDGLTAGQVASPQFDPPGGAIMLRIQVSLSTETAGAAIYYTLDGSEPDTADYYYSGSPVAISVDTTLTARAFKTGLIPSDSASADYVFESLPTEGLVAYWSLDEGSGSTVSDSSGNAHHGGLGSEVTWAGNGRSGGNALAFANLPGGEVTVADASSLRFGANDNYTVSFWVKVDAIPAGSQALFFKGNKPELIGIYLLNSGIVNYTAGSWRHVRSNTPIAIGTWQHIVAIQDSAHANDKRRLYINGAQVASRNSTESSASEGDLFIGSRGKSNGYEAFAGYLDEIRIYDRALTDVEIGALSAQE